LLHTLPTTLFPYTTLFRSGQQQKRVVALSCPRQTVGAGEKGVDLGPGEISDEDRVEAFLRDGKHPLNQLGVLWVEHGRVLEEGIDRKSTRLNSSHQIISYA